VTSKQFHLYTRIIKCMTMNTGPADFKEIWIKRHYVLKLLI